MEKGCYGNRDSSDVIVYLTPIFTIVLSGDPGSNKRKRAGEYPENVEMHLAALNLHSDRLRCCSKYFEICLDERWSNSNTKIPMEFFLEVHTDVEYYEDCFSRMYAPNFTGIPNVKHALELLKVASQINFGELTEACVCYLSLVQWSVVDEYRIRKFPFSMYVSPSDTSELHERLRLHGTTEESYQRLYEGGMEHLRSSLDIALENAGFSSFDCQTSCAIFAEAFHDVLQSGCCFNLAKDACTLVTSKAKGVLLEIPKVIDDSHALEAHFNMICWLLEILLKARGAKELVEVIARDTNLSSRLTHLSEVHNGVELYRNFKWPNRWALLFLAVFEEVLAGRLLLKSSDRVALFGDWIWIFEGFFYDEFVVPKRNAPAARTLGAFMMTLPLECQTTMLKEWLGQVDGDEPYVPRDIVEVAYPMWIKDLQRSLVALESTRAAEVVARKPGVADSSLSAANR